MWAQGLGAPLGFGLLEDTVGHDHYYCGGLYPNSYKTTRRRVTKALDKA